MIFASLFYMLYRNRIVEGTAPGRLRRHIRKSEKSINIEGIVAAVANPKRHLPETLAMVRGAKSPLLLYNENSPSGRCQITYSSSQNCMLMKGTYPKMVVQNTQN